MSIDDTTAANQLRSLDIPRINSTFEEFVKHVEEAIADDGCHFYFDTSFLIWLISLGKDARAEFLRWMDAVGRKRFHIPVWSGHEFLTHHIRDLIGTTLSKTASNLRSTADDTYMMLRPFLDEPIDGHSPQQLQVAARDTLLQLKRLAANVAGWKSRHYQVHFAEVAALVAELGLHGTSIFDLMSDIDVQERNRYSGRIPPGFQDRKKREKAVALLSDTQEEEKTVTIGSNRYGDLMFWQEVLAHASDPAIQSIVVLSNDRKNDWSMGGSKDSTVDLELRALRRTWHPVPVVHPLLAYEASTRAGINAVILIDSAYLAALFRKMSVPSIKFIDAALTIELPDFEREEKSMRKQKARAAMQAVTAVGGRLPSVKPQDGPAVGIGQIQLERAARIKSPTPLTTTVLGDLLQAPTGRPIDSLTPAFFQEATTTDLVLLGRNLHAKAIAGESIAAAALTDLISILPDVPDKSATCISLGMLVSIYFDDANQVRLPPAPLGLDQLLRWRGEEFTTRAIDALDYRFRNEDRKPVYIVQPSAAPIVLQVRTRDYAGRTPPPIVGLQFNGIELLTLAQGDSDLLLATLFNQRRPIQANELVAVATRLFGIPSTLVDADATTGRLVDYDPTTGFELPKSVYVS